MINYDIHTLESAPEASKSTLHTAKQRLGFIPNLMATMAEAPVLVESYLKMMGIFDKSELSETERQIILMTNNRLHGCHYCMAAHTAVSVMAGVDAGVIEALRSGTPLEDPKLESLRRFTIIMNETRGQPTQEQIEALLSAGYTKQTVLEVVVGTSLKVLSNYTSRITNPELDDQFAPVAWSEGLTNAA